VWAGHSCFEGLDSTAYYLRAPRAGNRSPSHADSHSPPPAVLNSCNAHRLSGIVHTTIYIHYWMHKMFQLEHISHMFQPEHYAILTTLPPDTSTGDSRHPKRWADPSSVTPPGR
jgi:hypothetical protein